MRKVCEHLRAHIPDVVAEWESAVRQEPWFSLPQNHRIDNLPGVVVGLVEASLCDPGDEAQHRRQIQAAVEHGETRRAQGIPDHLILTEFHLLRQALWRYMLRELDERPAVTQAILRIDTSISVASNASMWGYHRAEIEGLGKWEAGMERLVTESPLLRLAAETE